MKKYLSRKNLIIIVVFLLVLVALYIGPVLYFRIVHKDKIEEQQKFDELMAEIAEGDKAKTVFNKLNDELVIERSDEKLYSIKVSSARLYTEFAETGIPFTEINGDSLIFQDRFTREIDNEAPEKSDRAAVERLRYITCTLELSGIKERKPKDADYDNFSRYGISAFDEAHQKLRWLSSYPHIDKPLAEGKTEYFHIRLNKDEKRQVTLGFFVPPSYKGKNFYLSVDMGNKKPLYIDLELNE